MFYLTISLSFYFFRLHFFLYIFIRWKNEVNNTHLHASSLLFFVNQQSETRIHLYIISQGHTLPRASTIRLVSKRFLRASIGSIIAHHLLAEQSVRGKRGIKWFVIYGQIFIYLFFRVASFHVNISIIVLCCTYKKIKRKEKEKYFNESLNYRYIPQF